MIVVDTSAIVAILYDEPERLPFTDIILSASAAKMSVASLLEARIVLHFDAGQDAIMALDSLLLKSRIELLEVSPQMADIAFTAYCQYGKGTGSSAKLNYGDCFAYALAKHLNLPLLFKGNDFSQTDLVAAVDIFG